MKCLIKEKLSAHKYKDNNGYLICVDSVLARTGKQTYLRSEIFADAADDNTEVEVDRKPEEVFSDKTLASFENCPICVEHPDEDINPENYKEYAVGFVRDVHKGMDNGKEVILGTLVITDAKTIEEIENGEHTDLSCGYDCDIDDSAHPQQRNIRGNHVALCEQGRAGNARIVDSVKDDLVFGYTDLDLKKAEEMLAKAEDEKEKKLLQDLVTKIKFELKNKEYKDSVKDDTPEPTKEMIAFIKNHTDIEEKVNKMLRQGIGFNEAVNYAYIEGKKKYKDSVKDNFYYKVNENRLRASKDFKLKEYFKDLDEAKRKPISIDKENEIYNIKEKIEKRVRELEKVPNDIFDSVKDWNNVSSNSFGYARIYGIHNEEDLLKRANESEKVYIEQDYNGKTKGTWVSAKALYKEYKEGNAKFEDSVKDYQSIEVSNERIEEAPRFARNYIKENINKKEAALLAIEGHLEDIINAAQPELRSELKMKADKIIRDLKGQFNIKDSMKDVEPHAGESKEDFISRFMHETKEEYPDKKQRLAVACSYWEKKDMKDSNCKDETYDMVQKDGLLYLKREDGKLVGPFYTMKEACEYVKIKWNDSVKDDDIDILSKKYDIINRSNVDEFLRDFNKLYNRHLSADGGDIVNENYKDIYNVNGAGAQVEYLVKLLKNSIRDEKIIHVTLEGKTYKAVYNGMSSRYPDMADVYIPELVSYNGNKYTPADDLGNHPKDGKYYIKKDKIYMRDEETTAERVTEKLEKGFENFKESRMKDAKLTYFFRYKDLYHNEVHSEEIKANSVNEAIEELRRRVSLRGIGTANVYVNHIDIKETGEYYPFGYGKLNVLTIDSKKLIDAVKVAKLSKIIKNKK